MERKKLNNLLLLTFTFATLSSLTTSTASYLDANELINGKDYYAGGGSRTSSFAAEDYYAELGTGNENNDRTAAKTVKKRSTDDKNDNRGLFPSIFNLATNAIITTNATCGKKGPESYCKLVEHVFMRTPQCDACDDNHPLKRHPIEFAVDGTNRWWQSPTLANGLGFEWVTIELDLRQQYQVAYIIIKAGIAPRPGNWILERSLDRVEWKPWQYYAITDEECERAYGIKAVPGVPRFDTDDHVVCTSWYSRLDPIEDGEIHTSLVNGRPGVAGPSESLQEFTKARYIRLRLQRLKTLNSDLIYITRRDDKFRIDESVTRRYFYAIRDISVGGQCICYGHAESCPADPSTGQLRCECKHNTCGESCNECCPLFNQKPWQSGTTTQHNACEGCQCFNHADRCEYNADVEKQRSSLTPDGLYEGGGVCIDCKHNTQGINCQECKDNHYRPAGVSHYLPDACRSCDCELTGSVNSACVKDETQTTDDLKPGDCRCKTGFGGSRCDRCELGFRNYPVCDPCPCHRAGSANFATCDNVCICKRNVEGNLCDKCKPGYFNLDEDNPDGCTPCFCFGLTSECKELDWNKFQIRDMTGWNLTDVDMNRDVPITHDTSGTSLTVNVREIPDRSLFYWKAPPAYCGNLLTSYNGDLKYFVYYVTEGGGSPMHLADVVIKGNGITLEYHSRRTFYEKENVSVTIRFHESAGWYDKDSRRPVDKTKFMTALANVDAFLIRAAYHHSQVQASLYSITLDSAKQNSGVLTSKFTSVEQCSCPANFVGLSCESCAVGFRRVNNVLYKGTCERCSCNEHSDKCDPFTGHCLACRDNTMGPRCEHCIMGYYGNPSLANGKGMCQKCGCPLTEDKNNFSPTCMSAASANGDMSSRDYICTACPPGHMGNKCEWCADGFFGDPMTPGNYCQPCNCTGNIDPAAIGNCDRKTGQCLKCIGNTEGFNCEKCKADFYGNALNHDCRACNCNMFGSTISQCDATSGECQCKEHYVGRYCERCSEGFGDVENGCPACQCSKIGSHSDRCDAVSGQCQCKPGVFGKYCDTCSTGYFGFSESGCRYCGCYAPGSLEEGKCNSTSGQCFCKPNVSGQMCTICQNGFFNISSGQGCQPCNCHADGADGETCDQSTGQCRCKYGVTGAKCDKCDSNFYGLSKDGCKHCPLCPAVGHVCDPVTGQCVCPPFTVGEMCDSCAADTWNYHPLKGCEPCQCDSAGSFSTNCNLETGVCVCRAAYRGKKCDQCTHGHFNFPSCDACNCHTAGTDPKNCLTDGGCSCDSKGQCPCKKNVVKDKCTECDPTSFSLEADNPKGCTDCFCFNRTNFWCIQSSYVWQQIGAESRQAYFKRRPFTYWERKHGLQVMPSEPATLNSYPTDHTPVYWPMPPQFLGDKITSYNGYLRFRATNVNGNYLEGPARPDSRFFEQFPNVVLVGNHRIILEHYKKLSQINENGEYVVKFREDFWKSRPNPEIPVTRQTLMVALQNIQALYIRATYIDRPGEATLSDVSLDVGVWDNTTSPANNTAIGVEACDCPQGYTGSSCQNPADGYCRKKKTNYLDSESDLDLVGWAELCSCNSHSTTCDRESCRCTSCQHNTAGDFCEKCAVGYYGDAKRGAPEDCKKCACPTQTKSFSKSCYPVNYGEGYVCDQCAVGHTGLYCENCISGYYGDPVMDEKGCQLCKCNRYGSVSDVCDTKIGQCLCRPGVTGRDCSECQPRHALIGPDCRSCDEGCTKPLMSEVDDLETLLAGYNFTGLVPAPWGHLARIENQTSRLRNSIGDVESGKENFKEIVQKSAPVKKRVADAQALLKGAKYLQEKTNKSSGAIEDVNENGAEVLKEIDDLFRKIQDIHDLLVRYKISGAGDRSIPVNVTQWLLESANLLKEMEETTRYLEKRFNLAEKSLLEAKSLFEEVNMKTFNDTTLKLLKTKVDKITSRLSDAKRLIYEDVRKNLSSAEAITKITEKMFTEFKRVVDFIEDTKKDSEDVITSANDKLSGAKQSTLDVYDHYTEVNNSLLIELENATTECETKANHYADHLPQYREKFLFPSQKHVEDLELSAANLANTFAPIKDQTELPVLASAAYSNIKKAIDDADEASQKAKNASDFTYSEVFVDVGDSIVSKAKASLNKSNEMLAQARGLTTSELANSLKQYETRLTAVGERNINTRKAISDMEPRFSKFDDVSTEVEIVEKEARTARNKAEMVANKTMALAESAEEMVQKVKELAGFTGKTFHMLTDEVQKAATVVGKATEQLKELQEQAEKNKGNLERVTDNLALLKEKIKEAREKASKIKISVQSTDPETCVRTYASPAAPSPANNLHIEYRPSDDVADSLIFITKTNPRRSRPKPEFLALELVNRRFVFVWNVGGGDTTSLKKVTVPDRIDAFAKKESLQNLSWYLIDAERKGNFGNLTISISKKNGWTAPKRYSTQLADTDENNLVIFNTVPSDTRISLGLTDPKEKPFGVTNHQFRGIIGEIKFDDHPIPLWNFLNDTGHCKGYYESYTEERVDDSYLFADGYVQIPAVKPYRAQQTQLWLTFATYSENGLLYFRGNPVSKDFVSLELEEGKVKAQFNLGGNSRLSLFSEKTYNDGKKYSVQLSRNELEAEMEITGLEKEKKAATIPGKFKSLEADTDHLLGGVPESYPKKEWKTFNIQWKGFYGCIGSKIKVETYLDFLTANKTLNVKPGCTFSPDSDVLLTSDRVVSFDGDGLFVVPGIEFGPNSTLSVNFRTIRQEGLLFYQSSKVTTRRKRRNTAEGFIAGYLYQCTFVLTMATSQNDVITLQTSSNVTKSDLCNGRLHTVYIKRKDNEVSLFVDDELAKIDHLKSNDVIGSITGQLFLGGLGRITPPSNELPIYNAFAGCLSDIYLNFKRLSLIPQRFDNATLGFCVDSFSRYVVERGLNIQGTEPMLEDGFSDFAAFQLRNGERLLLDPPPADVAYHSSEIYDDDEEEETDTPTTTKKSVTTKKYFPSTKFVTTTIKSRDKLDTCANSVYTDPISDSLLFGLKIESFSGINLPANYNLTDVAISFSFRTDHPNGTLISWPNKDFKNYLFILLENGIVWMTMKIGKMTTPLNLYSDKNLPLNDGQWHDVSMIKKNGSLSLEIDNQHDLFRDNVPKKWSLKRTKGGLMVGGTRNSIAKRFNITYKSLAGCIKNFRLDGKSKSLTKMTRGTMACRKFRGDGVFFSSPNGSIFFENYPMKKLLNIYIEFRADNVTDGRILTFISNDGFNSVYFFSLKFKQGLIIADYGTPSYIYSSEIISSLLCDNRWHKVRINFENNEFKWRLDDANEISFFRPPDSVDFTKWTGHLYIGKVSGEISKSQVSDNDPAFIGCLKNIRVNDEPLIFADATEARTVVFNECPF